MITSMTIVDRRIGSAPFLYEGDFAAGAERAGALGYDGIELHAADPAGIAPRRLGEALKRQGLVLTAIGTGRAYVNEGLSITDADESRRRAAVARLEQFIDLAAPFGAKIIIGCMRGNISAPEELPGALERLGRSMNHLDRLAGEAGAEIVFEPINRYENNFLCTMGEIADFIRRRGLHSTGLLIDTFHMNIEEADLGQSIRQCAGEIRYVHLADSNRRTPGRGHIDFAALIGALREAGYDGVLSAECLPWPDGETAAGDWLREVRALLRTLEA